MKSFTRFVIKALALAIAPIILLTACYVYLDPFKVLRLYDNYFDSELNVNKGVVTANTFEHEYPLRHYNSFIVGSSITCQYELDQWVQFLQPGAVPYHFDSSGQPIATTRRCIEYLYSTVDDLKNVLIVLDPAVFRFRLSGSMVSIEPKQIHDEPWYPLYYHYKMFHHALNVKFLASYIPWLSTQRAINYSDAQIFCIQPIVWDRVKNEESMPVWNDSLVNHPEEFYDRHNIVRSEGSFYSIPGTLIDKDTENNLRSISEMLDKKCCDYRVVVSPNLRREILSATDDSLMHQIFGIHFYNLGTDFKDEISTQALFYDNTHYCPRLSTPIMRRVYSSNKQ